MNKTDITGAIISYRSS